MKKILPLNTTPDGCAFTIPANPMSDRVQMVIEYEERDIRPVEE